MSGQGHHIFADELARFAVEAGEPRLAAIARQVAAPLRVAVLGRRGVGRSTVAHALASAGLAVTASPANAEVDVYVIAEVVKPEDRDAIAATRNPVLMVLNKADLSGFAASGPIAAARSRCARFSELTGAPTEPMVGLLAVAALDGLLDDSLWAALRLLATRPADMRSPDGFLAGAHPVPSAVRLRLLETLDLFGITLAVAAIRRAAPAAAIGDLLRHVSGVDAVAEKVAALGTEARYRRVLDAVAELETLAVTDDRISDFLSADDTVIARMAAAVEVIEATGMQVDARDDPPAHLRRAVRWQRYSRGPAAAIYRSCGADIARGSLRLWSHTGGSP